jgi:NAD(P)-dependent dehydrogenase (short-subunit alcohol dehydrogenase family)
MKEQRTIVITGVGRGLGRAMTEEFIRLGHRVAGCSRTPQLISELRHQYGAPHRFEILDVTDDQAVQRWSVDILDSVGTPDLLVNNAAVINANRCLWEVPVKEFHALMNTNVNGTFHVLRAFIPAMVTRGSGTIVNFSSTWGRTTSPEVAPYCASKWAIEGLTRALADELPRGMAAVAFNPGVIHTEMLESCFGSGAAAYPKPSQWVKRASKTLLELGPADNGRSVSAS